MSRPTARRELAIYWLLTAGAFALGVGLLWGYLVREHRRLAPPEVALLWSSEAVNGFWFLRFGAWHLLLGRPLPAAPGRGEHRVVWATLLAGWLLDAGLTAYKHRDEVAAHARAVPADGRVLEARRWRVGRPGLSVYDLRGEYTDADGAAHPFHFHTGSRHLPPGTAAAVDEGAMPAPLPLLYDPARPARTWLWGEGPGGNRVYLVTAFPLVFQAILLLALADHRELQASRLGPLPVEQVGPFAVSAFGLLFFGVARWLAGHPAL